MSTILACTDGSQYAGSLCQHAAWVASKANAGVHVLHVIERTEAGGETNLSGNLGFDASTELLEELVSLDEAHARVARLRGKALLQDAERQLREAGISEVTTTQRHGSLVETLEEFEAQAELVVIGKRGEHADFAKGHLGSNLERVVRTATIPILVASRAFKPVEKVMIAFDGGTSALKAVHYASKEPLFKGCELHLVSVGKAGSSLEKDLDDAATGLRGAGFEVKAAHLQGDVEDVITAEVTSRGIDLLVMGAYGHSKIRQMVIGSTTTSLVRTCLVPILLFR